jgi:hypothetical protein
VGKKGNIIPHYGKNEPFTGDEQRQILFLEEYSRTGLFVQTCSKFNINPETVYLLKKKDSRFARALQAAKDLFTESLEREAFRRGVTGYLRGVYYQGMLVAKERYHSDRLLELALKARDPKYREHVSVDATVKAGVLVIQAGVKDIPEWMGRFGGKMDGNGGDLPPAAAGGNNGTG